MLNSLIWVGFFAVTTPVFAAGSTLPRGNLGISKGVEDKQSQKGDPFPCYADFAHPMGSEARWLAQGKKFYVSALRGKGQVSIVQGDPQAEELTAQLFVSQEASPLVMPMGKKSFITLLFDSKSELCRAGSATLRGEANGLKLADQGRFVLLEQENGNLRVADLDKLVVVDYDPQSLQRKRGIALPDGVRPIWLNATGDLVLALKKTKSERSIMTIPQSKKSLALKDGERLIVAPGGIALADFNTVAQTITVTSVNDLTRGDEIAQVKLPAPYPVATAALIVDVDAKRVLVFAQSRLARKSWGVVLVYNLRGKLLRTLSVAKGNIHGDPALYDGQVVMALYDESAKLTKGAWYLNLVSGKDRVIPIN